MEERPKWLPAGENAHNSRNSVIAGDKGFQNAEIKSLPIKRVGTPSDGQC